MWLKFLEFDVRYLARRPTLWLVTAVFCALMVACLWIPQHFLTVFGASVFSAPVNLAVVLGFLTLFGTFVLTGLIADTVMRDSEANTLNLLMATPVRARDYLTGRLLAGFACSLLAYTAAALVLVVVAARATPQVPLVQLVYHVGLPFLLLVIPNAFMLAVFVVAVACKTRSVAAVYSSVFFFYLLWALSAFPIFPVDEATRFQISAMADPFGTRALLLAVKGLSQAQLDTSWPLDRMGLLLTNRTLWLTLALGVFAWTAVRFSPFARKENVSKKKATRLAKQPAPSLSTAPRLPSFGHGTAVHQGLSLVAFDCKQLYRSVALRVLAGAGLLLVGAAMFEMSGVYGSRSVLTTAWVLSTLQENLAFPLTVLAIVLATDLMGKLKSAHMAELDEALPVAAWVRWASALVTVTLVLWGYALFIGAAGWLLQQLTELKIATASAAWLTWARMQGVHAFLLATLALSVQLLCRDRFIAYAVYLVYITVGVLVSRLAPEQVRWVYAEMPAVHYSDLAGMSTSLNAWQLAAAGWAGVAVLMALFAFVARPTISTVPARSAKMAGLLFAMAGTYFAAVTLLQPVVGPTATAVEQMQARYERSFSRYRDTPQLRVQDVRLEAALFPVQKQARLTGEYTLVNTTQSPIQQVHVTVNPFVDTKLTLPGARLRTNDKAVGYQIWELPHAVAPQERVRLSFDVKMTEEQPGNPVTEGVTTLTNHEYLPQIGYLSRTELPEAAVRTRQGLGARAVATPQPTDNHMEGHADWVSFHAVVSTDMGQVGLTSGDMVRNWNVNGRSFFEYQGAKILPYFAIVSGPFEKQSARVDGVELTAYYHKDHSVNVDRLLEVARKTVGSYQKQFGPYPHKELKLVEVPSTLRGAQSFPGMVTFFESSELNRHAPTAQPDPLLFLAAHEIAHQWWGHQLVGAKAPGAELLSETMAQHAALGLIKKFDGQAAYDKAMDYEKNRFNARKQGSAAEPGLLDVGYERALSYHKGALVFAELSKDIGEKQWNPLLEEFFQRYRYATPYPTSRDFLREVCASMTPAQCQKATFLLSSTRADPVPTRALGAPPTSP